MFALVIGLVDGILTALTLAAGRVVGFDAPLDVALAFRIAAGTSISGAFTFFTAEYARLRGELVHAERQLTLMTRGRMVATKLGGAILRETILGASISSSCSFLGALLPLLAGSLLPGLPWFAVLIAIGALALLGVGLARLVYGNPVRWAVLLMIAGGLLTLLGMKLQIV